MGQASADALAWMVLLQLLGPATEAGRWAVQLTGESKALLERLAADGHVQPDSEAARFPMAIGVLREDRDHLEQACWVCDVILNTQILRHAHSFRQAASAVHHTAFAHARGHAVGQAFCGCTPRLAASGGCWAHLLACWPRALQLWPCRAMKLWVALLALGAVGERHELKLDRRHKLPKMRYKGVSPLPQVVRQERPDLIAEVRDSSPWCPCREAWPPCLAELPVCNNFLLCRCAQDTCSMTAAVQQNGQQLTQGVSQGCLRAGGAACTAGHCPSAR